MEYARIIRTYGMEHKLEMSAVASQLVYCFGCRCLSASASVNAAAPCGFPICAHIIQINIQNTYRIENIIYNMNICMI